MVNVRRPSPFIDAGRKAPEKSEAQVSCESKGGRWDARNRECNLPAGPRKPEVKPEPSKAIPPPEKFPPAAPPGTVITDQDTGKATGFISPSGQFIQADKDAIQVLLNKQAEEAALTSGLTGEKFAKQAGIEQAQETLQTTGAPVRRELDPTIRPGEETPIIGPLGIKIGEVLQGLANKILPDVFDEPITASSFITPEELKTAALSQIEKNEIERGLTDSEKFGSFVEALSLGGLSNFAAEKPSENVQTILRELKTQKTRATNAEIKVKDGTWRQTYGEEVIDEIDNNIQRMESRIKLLLQDSPEFKFDSDGVNFIEEKIFEARERLFQAKINIVEGETNDPSEIQMLIALRKSIQEESFEI